MTPALAWEDQSGPPAPRWFHGPPSLLIIDLNMPPQLRLS
jgi:hypothetical protein